MSDNVSLDLNWELLVNNLKTPVIHPILDRLRSRVLSPEEYDTVYSFKGTDHDKVRTLLPIVGCRGEPAIQVFKEALKELNPELYERLEQPEATGESKTSEKALFSPDLDLGESRSRGIGGSSQVNNGIAEEALTMELVQKGDSQPTIAELSPRNKLFKKIDKSITETEVESLRSLMITDSLIERGRVQNASPHQMLNMLEADGKIGAGNLGLLKELLTALNKGKLVQETEAVERQEEKAAAQLMERKRVATEDTDTLAICIKKPKPCPPSTEGQSEISSGYGGTSPSRSGIQSEEEAGLSQDGHDISFEGITEAELHERIQELQKTAAIYTSECCMEEAGKVFDELSMLTKRRDRERKGELGFRISLLDRTPEVQEKQEKAYTEGELHKVLQQHLNKTIEKNSDMLEIETEVEVLDEPEVDHTRRNHKQEWLKGQFGIIKVHAKSVKLREDYVHSEGKPGSVDRLFDHLVENRDELDPIVTYLNGMKVQVYDITRGCIILKFCCLTTESSDNLQDEYNSQRLSDRFQNFMETSALLQQFGLESVLLDIECIFFNKDAEKTDDPAEEPCNDMETECKLEEYEVEASKQSTAKPGDISIAPSGVTENSISITWEEAAGPGKVSYDVSITLPSGDNHTERVDDGASLEYSFTGLMPGTLYTISVTTVGGEVVNAESTVQLRTFPAPPDEISIVDKNNKSISITWAEAVGTKDHYRVSISPPDGDNPTAKVDDGEPLEYSFTGLTSGTLYTVSVTTVSGGAKSAGRSKEQRMSIADTEITHDSDVTEICEKDHEHEVADASYKSLGLHCDVSIAPSEVTKNSINITWAEAAGPGKVSYDISITPPDGGNPTQRVDDGAPPEYSFISPTSGTVSGKVKSVTRTKEQRTSQPIPRLTQEYPLYQPCIHTTRSVLDILHLDGVDLPKVLGEQPKMWLPTERDSRKDDLLDELGNLQIPELQEITSEHVSLDIVELEQLMGPRRERSTSMGSKTSGYHTDTQGSGPSRPDSLTGENDMQTKLEALLDKINTNKVMEDKAQQSDLYCQIGDLYRTKLHDSQSALQYYQHMLECARALSEDTKQAKAYSRLGLTCDILGLQQEAYRNHKEALTIYRVEIKNETDICIAYKNLASSLALSGQVSDAKTNYESALAVAMETGNKTEQMDIYCKLGDLHKRQLHEPQVSHKYYTEMLVLARNLGRKDWERLTYNRLGLACEDMQDYEAALEWHQKEEQLPAYLNDCYKPFKAYHHIDMVATMLMIYYRHKHHGCTGDCPPCHIMETMVTHMHACNNDHCLQRQFLARAFARHVTSCKAHVHQCSIPFCSQVSVLVHNVDVVKPSQWLVRIVVENMKYHIADTQSTGYHFGKGYRQVKMNLQDFVWAAKDGDVETVRRGLEEGLDVNTKYFDGDTALHKACRGGHDQVVELFIKNGADLNVTHREDNKYPVDVAAGLERYTQFLLETETRKQVEYRELVSSAGSEERTTIKLILCGDGQAGKTSLQAILRKTGFTRREDAFNPTLGVHVSSKTVGGFGRLRLHDFAGQAQFYVTHAMLLRTTNAIFPVIYKITDGEDKQKRQIHGWLSFICCSNTDPTYKPRAVLIASHVDKLQDQKAGLCRATALVDHYKELFQESLVVSQEVFLMNCLEAGSREIQRLREVLAAFRDDMLKQRPKVPKVCIQLLAGIEGWREERKTFPVMSWQEYLTSIKHATNGIFKERIVQLASSYLHDEGEIISLRQEPNSLVVLDPQWLNTSVFGPLLASNNFDTIRDKINRTAEDHVTREELTRVFSDIADIPLLIKLLQDFQLCHTHDSRTFILPSLLQKEMEESAWSPVSNKAVYFGLQIRCRTEVDSFSCDLFPRVQTLLMQAHQNRLSQPLLWKNSAKCTDGKAEALLKITTDKRQLNIFVRSHDGNREDCNSIMDILIDMTYRLLHQTSPGARSRDMVLSALDLREHRSQPYAYSREEVLTASAKGENLIHPRRNIPEKVMDLVHDLSSLKGMRGWVFQKRPELIHHQTNVPEKVKDLLQQQQQQHLGNLKEGQQKTCESQQKI